MATIPKRHPRIRKIGKEYVKFWGFRPRFKGGRYTSFEKEATRKKYNIDIIKVYPIFTYNRGMGYFFPKLNMELDGTPAAYAMFEVSD